LKSNDNFSSDFAVTSSKTTAKCNLPSVKVVTLLHSLDSNYLTYHLVYFELSDVYPSIIITPENILYRLVSVVGHRCNKIWHKIHNAS